MGSSMETKPISVLVVDDSALMRNLITKIFEQTDDLEVVGKAMNGEFALQKIPLLSPEFIVLDLEMPKMNGVEFLRAKKEQGIEIPVVILSSIARRGAQETMDALALGASDFIMKPSGSISNDVHKVGDHLIELARGFGMRYRMQKAGGKPVPGLPQKGKVPSEARKDSLPPRQVYTPPTPSAPRKLTPKGKPGKLELIAFGVSTGGPNALRKVFSALRSDLNLPIVVVQHMPAGFTSEFAKSLDRICPLQVKEAEDGDLLKPGRILITPGDYHMTLEKKPLATIVRLNQTQAVNGHRPSCDVLFESVAKHYGNKALGVIMTGMGRDGAEKLGDIYLAGGITLGQDERSSIVYGMPRAAYELGHVSEQLELEAIPSRINELAKELS